MPTLLVHSQADHGSFQNILVQGQIQVVGLNLSKAKAAVDSFTDGGIRAAGAPLQDRKLEACVVRDNSIHHAYNDGSNGSRTSRSQRLSHLTTARRFLCLNLLHTFVTLRAERRLVGGGHAPGQQGVQV